MTEQSNRHRCNKNAKIHIYENASHKEYRQKDKGEKRDIYIYIERETRIQNMIREKRETWNREKDGEREREQERERERERESD